MTVENKLEDNINQLSLNKNSQTEICAFLTTVKIIEAHYLLGNLLPLDYNIPINIHMNYYSFLLIASYIANIKSYKDFCAGSSIDLAEIIAGFRGEDNLNVFEMHLNYNLCVAVSEILPNSFNELVTLKVMGIVNILNEFFSEDL